MARPIKQTVDYFPHVTKHNKTIPLLKSKFGAAGYAVFFQTLELLGRSEGHFYDISDEIDWLFFVSEMGLSETETRLILDFCARLNAIDKELYENGIIWSENFIENLKTVYERRKSEMPSKPVIENRNRVNDSNNPVSDSQMRQSRVEESIVEKDMSEYSDRFLSFWKAYPKKTGKKKCYAVWKKNKCENGHFDEIMAAIESQIKWRAEARGQFIPEWKNPETWLNKGCWEDEPGGGEEENQWR